MSKDGHHSKREVRSDCSDRPERLVRRVKRGRCSDACNLPPRRGGTLLRETGPPRTGAGALKNEMIHDLSCCRLTAIRRYGKDFTAIAEVIGTKTPAQVSPYPLPLLF